MVRTWSIVLFEWSEVQVVCILSDETISKCLYNLFLAVQQIHRATLADFSETNGVVYAKFHKSIIRIAVLYELIKCITVLYMPNQAHNFTVWLIQYSYATLWAIQHTFSLWSSHAKYNIWKYGKSTRDSACLQDRLVRVKRWKGDYASFSVLSNILQNVLNKKIAC